MYWQCCPNVAEVVSEVFGFPVTLAILKSSKNIIHMCSENRTYCDKFSSVPDSRGFCKQRDRRVKLQRTIRLPKGACKINVIFVGSIAVDLESPIDGVCSKLSVTTGQIRLQQSRHLIQLSHNFFRRQILNTCTWVGRVYGIWTRWEIPIIMDNPSYGVTIFCDRATRDTLEILSSKEISNVRRSLAFTTNHLPCNCLFGKGWS